MLFWAVIRKGRKKVKTFDKFIEKSEKHKERNRDFKIYVDVDIYKRRKHGKFHYTLALRCPNFKGRELFFEYEDFASKKPSLSCEKKLLQATLGVDTELHERDFDTMLNLVYAVYSRLDGSFWNVKRETIEEKLDDENWKGWF